MDWEPYNACGHSSDGAGIWSQFCVEVVWSGNWSPDQLATAQFPVPVYLTLVVLYM